MSVSSDGILFYGCLMPEGWKSPEEWDGEVPDEFGITLGWHCSDRYPMPYLAITETHTIAWRGYPKQVNDLFNTHPESAQDEWIRRFKKFSKQTGIKLEPLGWYLASWWG